LLNLFTVCVSVLDHAVNRREDIALTSRRRGVRLFGFAGKSAAADPCW
jgi:hypothetical protein